MRRYFLLSVLLVGLSACDSSQDTQSDPIDNNQEQNQVDGNTAPASRDPTSQTGSGGQSPATSPTGTVQR